MIHRASRDRLAIALRHYLAGRISNDDLDGVEVDWRDRGAVAVKQRAWLLYDDVSQHRARGRHAIGRDGRRQIAIWIAFLYCDLEYTWPEYSFIQIVNWPLDLLTFGWWEKRKAIRRREFTEAGAFEVWPFCDHHQYRAVLARPKLLAGEGAFAGR